MHTSLHFTNLHCALHILHFVFIEGLWQPYMKQVCGAVFPRALLTSCFCVTFIGNSLRISSVFIIVVFVMVVCDQ